MNSKKVTVVLFPDEDGGYTAIMPYFSSEHFFQGGCLSAQGWTAEEALAEARIALQRYVDINGQDGRYHLEYAHLDGIQVRDIEVEVGD